MKYINTEIYKKIEEKLKEEAVELRNKVEDRILQRERALRSIHAVNIQELKEYVEADNVNDTLIIPLLTDEIKMMGETLERLAKEDKEKQVRGFINTRRAKGKKNWRAHSRASTIRNK